MEFLQTLKDFFEMLYFIFSSFPKEFQIGVVMVFLLALFLTFGLSKSCDKKKPKKEQERETNHSDEQDTFEDTIEEKNDDIDMINFSLSAKRDDFNINEREIETILTSSNEENLSLDKIRISTSDKFDIAVFEEINKKEVFLDYEHKIDLLKITSKGIFIVFFSDLGIKHIYGESDNEFLYFDGEKRNNPTFQKLGYERKLAKMLNISSNKIKTILIVKDAEFIQSSLDIFKNEDGFESYLLNKKEVINNEDFDNINKAIKNI